MEQTYEQKASFIKREKNELEKLAELVERRSDWRNLFDNLFFHHSDACA